MISPPTLLGTNHKLHPMNEAETIAEHIDPALKAAGWGVVDGSKILREYRITGWPHRRARTARQGGYRGLCSRWHQGSCS